MREESIKSVVLWITKIGVFIIPFIPLYVSKVLFFPYITGKAFVFRIAVEIVFAGWVFLAIFYKEYRPKLTPLLIAVGFFILIATLATIFGVNPSKSFWSNFERMEGLVTYLHLFAYFLVLSNVFQKRDWFIFLHLFVASGIYENVYVLFQRLGYLSSPQGGVRTDGTIGNPTYLAAYLIFILGFCLWLLLNAKNKLAKYFYGFVGLFTLLSIYFTASRGPTLALFAGAFAALLVYVYLKPSIAVRDKLIKKMAIAGLVLLILIPVGFWLLRASSLVKNSPSLNRLTMFSFKERTIISRFSIWRMSFEGFKERPILGWGPDNYGIVFSKYFKPELWRQEPWFDRSHNIVFDWLINAGILGLAAYLGIFAAVFYLIRQAYRKNLLNLETAILIPILLIVYLLQNFFVFDNLATYIGFFTILSYVQSAVTKNESVNSRKEKMGNLYPLVAAAVLPALLILAVYFINIRPLLANLNLLRALVVQNQDIPAAFDKLTKALSYGFLGREEIREQLIRFSISAGSVPELGADFRDKVLRRAIAEAEKSVVENPLDPRPHLFLGMVYQAVGLPDQALAVFNKAAELSPKKQQIYFQIADMHIQKGDYPNATQILEKAFYLDQDYDEARLNLAAVHILNGRQEIADDLLIKGFGTVDVAKNILIQVYSQTKNYDRLVGVWQAFTRSVPSNIEYRKNLAGAYLLAGKKNEAIRVLEETIELNPAFKTEGESYIKQILSGSTP